MAVSLARARFKHLGILAFLLILSMPAPSFDGAAYTSVGSASWGDSSESTDSIGRGGGRHQRLVLGTTPNDSRRPEFSRIHHHPIYKPEKVKCSYCKQYGHSLMNCRVRMDHHYDMMEKKCKFGFHKPHLHDNIDLFRCEWCLTHLHKDYVRVWYPREYEYERSRVSADLARNYNRYAESTDES